MAIRGRGEVVEDVVCEGGGEDAWVEIGDVEGCGGEGNGNVCVGGAEEGGAQEEIAVLVLC